MAPGPRWRLHPHSNCPPRPGLASRALQGPCAWLQALLRFPFPSPSLQQPRPPLDPGNPPLSTPPLATHLQPRPPDSRAPGTLFRAPGTWPTLRTAAPTLKHPSPGYTLPATAAYASCPWYPVYTLVPLVSRPHFRAPGNPSTLSCPWYPVHTLVPLVTLVVRTLSFFSYFSSVNFFLSCPWDADRPPAARPAIRTCVAGLEHSSWGCTPPATAAYVSCPW